MIILLRKIRKRLIKNGSFSSYLLYALGEILLVVIGILVALQVNNWNQNRKEGIEERKALQNLKEDFEFNQVTLQNAIHRLKNQMANSVSILENTGNKYNSTIDAKLDSFLIAAASTPRYFPQNGF